MTLHYIQVSPKNVSVFAGFDSYLYSVPLLVRRSLRKDHRYTFFCLLQGQSNLGPSTASGLPWHVFLVRLNLSLTYVKSETITRLHWRFVIIAEWKKQVRATFVNSQWFGKATVCQYPKSHLRAVLLYTFAPHLLTTSFSIAPNKYICTHPSQILLCRLDRNSLRSTITRTRKITFVSA